VRIDLAPFFLLLINQTFDSQLAEQYGSDVASEVMARSRSNLNLDAMPTMPYNSGTQASGHSYNDSKYGSLRDRAPDGAS
jgi:hypothetical protein